MTVNHIIYKANLGKQFAVYLAVSTVSLHSLFPSVLMDSFNTEGSCHLMKSRQMQLHFSDEYDHLNF